MRPSSRLRFLALLLLFLGASPAYVSAQPEEEVVEDDASEPAGTTPTTPATPTPTSAPAYEEEYVEEDSEETTPDATEPTEPEGDQEDDLADRRRRRWLAPEPTFTVHGYLRTRGEWQDHFALSRTQDTSGGREGYPFRYFLPLDRGATVYGGCSSSSSATASCFSHADRLRYANMRMRLEPTLSISDDVSVHMVLDVFDNMVLGSTPDASSYLAFANGTELAPGVPLDFFTRTLNPGVAGRNSAGNSIYVRRAWAEVHNRFLGELRFGRMANHWGLGMLWNGGAGIDSDYSTDVDRVMVSRDLFGFTVGAAWDFMDEGVVVNPGNLNGLSYDGSDHDDVRQFSFFAAHTLTPEEEQARLERGDVALVGGLYYQYRTQDFGYATADTTNMDGTRTLGSSFVSYNPTTSATDAAWIRRGATSHTIDGWARFRWKDLRVELEAALVLGHVRSGSVSGPAWQDMNLDLLQFGYALEAEYRVLDRKLGIFFNTGYSTGDRDVNGISIREDTLTQDSGSASDGNATHFTFHPNYRIDLILFRNILGAIGGAHYFRPSLSYDLLRTDAGQLLGIRADVIYSRASNAVQVYGGSQNLGLELDASVYYRSEDGPDLLDGFWASFHYGILFPLDGLGYRSGELLNANKLGKAQTLRVVLGVQF